MQIPRNAFREYDIRGEAERDLSSDLVAAIGAHFAEQIDTSREDRSRPLTIAVGRDGRHSSPRLFEALTDGLRRRGANVQAIGVGPTPLLYFAAHHLGTDASIMITGSHNPAPDNGFKLMRGKASFFGSDIQTLADSIASGSQPASTERGELVTHDLENAYVDNIKACARIDSTDVPFVVDAGNGAAGPLGLKTLRALGFDPHPMFCDIDGDFPNHHPDPTVEANLVALRQKVLSRKARLGIAWDGDGDRIGALDETGEVVWGDKLMILFSRAVLREHPGATILGEVKCSETLYRDIKRNGGRGLISKTGHSLIKTMMKTEGALLAGEMSGHIFFADRYKGYDDGIYAAVRLLEIVAQSKGGLSELLADVPKTYVTPEIRVECDDNIKFKVVDGVREHFKKQYSVLETDGARIDFGDGAWGLCRASNTQPVLVLRFEALTEARRDEIRGLVEKLAMRMRDELLKAK